MNKSQEELDVEDIREALKNPSEPFRKGKLSETLEDEVGHKAYKNIIEELAEKGVIEDIREDLINPEKDPQGFKTEEKEYGTFTEHKNLEGGLEAGWLSAPQKNPKNIFQIQSAVKDYLMCVGSGFRFDGEMNVNYIKEHRLKLEKILSISELEQHDLEVEKLDNNYKVTLKTNGKTYKNKFEQHGDWVQEEAFEPIEKALNEIIDERIVYTSGNLGLILVLDGQNLEILSSIIDLVFFNAQQMPTARL